MILGIQIIGIIFGFLMVYMVFLNYKRKDFSKKQLLIWEIIWIAFIFIILFPNFLSVFTKKMGFVRTMDFLMLSGFIIITFLTFYNYSFLHKINKKLEYQVREEALKNFKK